MDPFRKLSFMKKISKISWERFKKSDDGRDAISTFEMLASDACSPSQVLNVAKIINPDYFSNISAGDLDWMQGIIGYHFNMVPNVMKAMNFTEDESRTYDELYVCAMIASIEDTMGVDLYGKMLTEIPQSSFKMILHHNIWLTTALYSYFPDFYIPNLFPMQFIYLKKFAEKYEIELPGIPNRSDYFARNEYWFEVNVLLHQFASENELNSGAELCAFIYYYELPLLKEELINEKNQDMPEYPGQAWILVGNYGNGEKDMEHGFWQANQLTKKGDILLFYEKSPVKALNSIWIAQEDGVVDPFFYYYSNTYIGDRIIIPNDQSVTFNDFKSSEYFKNRDKTGNYVSKNFQDVSGWEVTSEDYEEIKRILAAKGFDTNTLPSLYEPNKIGDVHITNENDVSELLLMPLLEQMGWHQNRDYRREVHFNAGRGETGADVDKRPDFCLHIKENNDDIESKVVIEVKEFMKNEREIHANFVQGRSYAKWGNAKVLVLCDKKQILVYQRDAKNSFSESKAIHFSWFDMENTDKYNELKRLLSR